MKISHNTPCNLFEIKKPIWNGRKVGLATYKIGIHNEIRIMAKSKNGFALYPNPFYASGEFLKTCPTQQLPSGVKLYLVNISDLELLEREELPPYEILDD